MHQKKAMTKLYGIIGNPVKHSFSPDYFNAKFQKLGLPYRYDAYELSSIEEITNLLKDKPTLAGFNVTSPFKEAIIPYLTNIDVAAQEIGAVNTVVRQGDTLLGYNTDIIGFDKTIASLGISGEKCLVLGNGGASSAVKYVLSKRSMPFVQVSRTKKRDFLTYKDLKENHMRDFPIIINTTPLGMMNRINEKPALSYQYLGADNVLVDLVYKPRTTRFLLEGLNRGTRIKNGFQMLIEQAEASWKIWSDNAEKL